MKALHIVDGHIQYDSNGNMFKTETGSIRKYQGICDYRCKCQMKALPVCNDSNGDVDHYHAIFSEQGFRYIKEEDFPTIEQASEWLTAQYAKILHKEIVK